MDYSFQSLQKYIWLMDSDVTLEEEHILNPQIPGDMTTKITHHKYIFFRVKNVKKLDYITCMIENSLINHGEIRYKHSDKKIQESKLSVVDLINQGDLFTLESVDPFFYNLTLYLIQLIRGINLQDIGQKITVISFNIFSDDMINECEWRCSIPGTTSYKILQRENSICQYFVYLCKAIYPEINIKIYGGIIRSSEKKFYTDLIKSNKK